MSLLKTLLLNYITKYIIGSVLLVYYKFIKLYFSEYLYIYIYINNRL